MATTGTSSLASDLPCMRCNYNLRTLTAESLCPECALPVKNSLAFHANRLPLPPAAGTLLIGAAFALLAQTLGGAFHIFVLVYPLAAPVVRWQQALVVGGATQVLAHLIELAGLFFFAKAGLAPRWLKWGGIHAPLFLCSILFSLLVVFAISGLGLGLGLSVFSPTRRILVITDGLEFIANCLSLVNVTYSVLFLRSLTERPELLSLRKWLFPLFAAAVILNLAASFTVTHSLMYYLLFPRVAALPNMVTKVLHGCGTVVDFAVVSWLFVLAANLARLKSAQDNAHHSTP